MTQDQVTLHDYFLEVALEAEVNAEEHPELAELARTMCNEYPATRQRALQELRDMIYERGECSPVRTDDLFLIKFLRARKFIVPRAHKLLVRYCTFREQYSYLYKDVDLFGLMKVGSAYEGLMEDRPDTGRISVLRFGVWDPSEFPVEDLVRAGMVTLEIGLRQPRLQVMGGTVIVDLEGITLRHVATLTPTVAYQISSLLGVAMPATVHSCHIINYTWIINTFIYLFKRLVPQKAWEKVHFHGYDLKSLHSHIRPELLPSKYGGTSKSWRSLDVWLSKIKKYRDELFDKDMKTLGYVIKE